jgi:hypothetical protein
MLSAEGSEANTYNGPSRPRRPLEALGQAEVNARRRPRTGDLPLTARPPEEAALLVQLDKEGVLLPKQGPKYY